MNKRKFAECILCITALLALPALLPAGGCSRTEGMKETGVESVELSRDQGETAGDLGKARDSEMGRDYRLTLPWGEAPDGMGLFIPPGEGAVEGPSDVRALPGGSILVLDRFNGRVVEVYPSGGMDNAALVSRDAVHLENGPDRGLGVYSRLRSTVFLYDEHGTPAGELKVSRRIREIRGFNIGPSREITVHTAFQSRYELGNPESPRHIHAILRNPLDGTFPDSDGAGLAVMLNEKGFSLLEIEPKQDASSSLAVSVAEPPSSGRKMERTHRIWGMDEDVSSVRLVGRADGIVCMRLEKARSAIGEDNDNQVTVEREVLCVDMVTENVLLRRTLPPVGIYLPGRDLVMGTDPIRVVHIETATDGLKIYSWAVALNPERRER